MARSIPLIWRMEREPFMLAGRFLAQAIAAEPDYAWNAYRHVFLAVVLSCKPYLAVLGHLRRDQEAAVVRDRLLALEPGFSIERLLATSPMERACDRTRYAKGLRLAGIPARETLIVRPG